MADKVPIYPHMNHIGSESIPATGTLIGERYRVLGRLGSGGQGAVLKVIDTTSGNEHEPLALKVVNWKDSDDAENIVKRLNTEYAVLSKLDHPNIVKVYVFGTINDSSYFIVTKCIEGISLRDRLLSGQNPFSFKETMHILREVALGLEHVHEQKIIHRNINPTNIILTSTGGINITDFNIACEIMQAAPLVIDQEIIGTPAYMAPEQITKQMPLDPRTDIYTFGILAYEFVTGKQPFMGCTLFELLQAHLYQPIPLIDSADRKLPPWYNFFIGVCTEKKPPKRFQTMREIIDFLEQRMERLKFIEQSTNPAPWWITPLWYLTFGKEKPREYYT